MAPEPGAGEALLERGEVLAAVRACLGAALEGRGQALFILGDAGLGKTSLLEAARRERPSEMESGFARGDPSEAGIAYCLVSDLVASLGGADEVRIGLGAGPVDTSAPRYRVARWLEGRAATPTLLALDDLHWADPDSLDLLGALVPRLGGMPVAMVGALRSWPPAAEQLCSELAASGRCRVQRLAPLSLGATGELIRRRAALEVTGEVERWAWESCGGNPLLLEHVAAALEQGETLPTGSALTGTLGGPVQAALLLGRFVGLDSDALACAQAAAVLGGSASPELVEAVAALDSGRARAGLAALAGAGVLTSAGNERVSLAHPLLAEALHADLGSGARMLLHRRAFRVLAEMGREAEAAVHVPHAELAGNSRAIALLERVGRAGLAAGAIVTASKALESALALAGKAAPAGLQLMLAEALAAGARFPESVELAGAVLERSDSDWLETYRGLSLKGRALLMSGQINPSCEVLEAASALALAHGDAERAVPPLLDLSVARWVIQGPGAAADPASRARAVAAGASSEMALRAEAEWVRVGYEAGEEGAFAAGEALRGTMSARIEQPLTLDELALSIGPTHAFGCYAWEAEHREEAFAAFEAVIRSAEATGALGPLTSCSASLAPILARHGRLDAAVAEMARGEAVADLYGGSTGFVAITRAEVACWQGRLGEVEALCTRAEAVALPSWHVGLQLAAIRGLARLWQGDPSASEMFLGAESLTRDAGLRVPGNIPWATHAIQAHLAVGRRADAERVVAWLAGCPLAPTCRWPKVAESLGRAWLAALDGDDDLAESHFEAALHLHVQTELPLEEIETNLAFGGFLRRRGRRARARDRLERALVLAEAAGAGWLASTARRELELARGRRSAGPEQRLTLTVAERQVAALAADGLTNLEIARQLGVSARTVETHLGHVLAKLGISSRRELARMLPAS